jgi:hypothetical protein
MMGESNTKYSYEGMVNVIDADLLYRSKVKVTQFLDLRTDGERHKWTNCIILLDHFNQRHTISFVITLASQ